MVWFLVVGAGLDAGLGWQDDGNQTSERTRVRKYHRSDVLSEGDAKVAKKKQDVADDWK
jgi:hypothetical protein